jgi:ABC-type transporter Mla maintaining outer membrane lipid asymmetry ATPase subunit MlaF
MTLVGNPRLIFLDEPTTGLDPRSRRSMWQIIRQLVAEEGLTIFLSTQYLEEADHLVQLVLRNLLPPPLCLVDVTEQQVREQHRAAGAQHVDRLRELVLGMPSRCGLLLMSP